jgi:hypothetical protein
MPKPLKSTLLSVRLTPAERDALLLRAGGSTLSAHVKAVLFEGPQPTQRTSGVTVANRTLLAHLLATLGASRLAPNLERLAHEAFVGNLFADEETIRRLAEACDDVRLMHNALMRGLGMKEKSASHHEISASAAFNLASKPGDDQ